MMLHFQAEDVVRTWLEAICPSDEPSDSFVAERASEWAPATLKQVFTSVMSLGKAAGRLGETMLILGQQEASLRQLREKIGIPRAAPPHVLPRVAVVQESQDMLWSPGGWIPDIIDRAAGLDVLRESGDPTVPLDHAKLASAAPDHVFVLSDREGEPTIPPGLSEFNVRIHCIGYPERWVIPGPDLPQAIFEVASYLHGNSSIFSVPADHQSH
jgi:ABC-type Fe3+-hydroxamate transport system substrate-binding protein